MAKGPAARDRGIPRGTAQKPGADVDRAARQAETAEENVEDRQQQGDHGVRVFQRIEREIAGIGDGMVAAEIGREGVAELVQAKADDPARHDEQEDREPAIEPAVPQRRAGAGEDERQDQEIEARLYRRAQVLTSPGTIRTSPDRLSTLTVMSLPS